MYLPEIALITRNIRYGTQNGTLASKLRKYDSNPHNVINNRKSMYHDNNNLFYEA